MSQRIQTPFLVFGMKLRHLFLLLLCGTIQIPVSFQMIETIGYVGFEPGAPEPIDVDYLFPEDRGSRLETRWGTFTKNNFTRNSTGRLIVKRLLVGPEGSPGSLDYSDWRLTQLPDLTPYRDVRYLNLERNDIDSLQPLHGRVPKMKHLNLGGNPVSDLGP